MQLRNVYCLPSILPRKRLWRGYVCILSLVSVGCLGQTRSDYDPGYQGSGDLILRTVEQALGGGTALSQLTTVHARGALSLAGSDGHGATTVEWLLTKSNGAFHHAEGNKRQTLSAASQIDSRPVITGSTDVGAMTSQSNAKARVSVGRLHWRDDSFETLVMTNPGAALWTERRQGGCTSSIATSVPLVLHRIFSPTTQTSAWLRCVGIANQSASLWIVSKETGLPVAVWVQTNGSLGHETGSLIEFLEYSVQGGTPKPRRVLLTQDQLRRVVVYETSAQPATEVRQ